MDNNMDIMEQIMKDAMKDQQEAAGQFQPVDYLTKPERLDYETVDKVADMSTKERLHGLFQPQISRLKAQVTEYKQIVVDSLGDLDEDTSDLEEYIFQKELTDDDYLEIMNIVWDGGEE